jgi:hypothetical protein
MSPRNARQRPLAVLAIALAASLTAGASGHAGPAPEAGCDIPTGVPYGLPVPSHCGNAIEYQHGDITDGESEDGRQWIIYQHNGVTYVRPR